MTWIYVQHSNSCPAAGILGIRMSCTLRSTAGTNSLSELASTAYVDYHTAYMQETRGKLQSRISYMGRISALGYVCVQRCLYNVAAQTFDFSSSTFDFSLLSIHCTLDCSNSPQSAYCDIVQKYIGLQDMESHHQHVHKNREMNTEFTHETDPQISRIVGTTACTVYVGPADSQIIA